MQVRSHFANQILMDGKFSFLKPDFKSVIPEVWKDIIKSTVVAGLGALGLLLVTKYLRVPAACVLAYIAAAPAYVVRADASVHYIGSHVTPLEAGEGGHRVPR